jgi:heterodisulfide reductase subunit A
MDEPKVGVYVCDCGINIAATVNVPEVVAFSKRLPNVVVARENSICAPSPARI